MNDQAKHYLMHVCIFVITILAVIIAHLLTPLVTTSTVQPGESLNVTRTVSKGTKIDIMADHGYKILAYSESPFSIHKDSEGILMNGIQDNQEGLCSIRKFCTQEEVVGSPMENRQLFHIKATRAEKPLRLLIYPLSVRNQDQIYWVKFTLAPTTVTVVRWSLFLAIWCFFWPTLTRPVIGHFKRKDL